jgi:hypothetical protein
MGVGGFSSTEAQQRSVRRPRWLGYDGWAYVDGFTGHGAERGRHVKRGTKTIVDICFATALGIHASLDNPCGQYRRRQRRQRPEMAFPKHSKVSANLVLANEWILFRRIAAPHRKPRISVIFRSPYFDHHVLSGPLFHWRCRRW